MVFDVRPFPLVCNEKAYIDFDAVKTGNVACTLYRGADKSLDRPGRKQANVSVRMT